MADEDIDTGAATAAEETTVEAPDWDLYWYPPGKTEPELRPVSSEPEPVSEPESAPTSADDENGKRKRGKLPDNFPHLELLRAGGVSTYAQARNLKGDYSSIDGIAEHRGAEIDAALSD